jgi:hypothetical protein
MKIRMFALASAALLLAGCASGFEKYATSDELAAAPPAARAQMNDPIKAPVGVDYMIVRYPGLPDVPGSTPAIWSPRQYRQLQFLWAHGCVDQLKPATAGTKRKSIGKETLGYAAAQGLGLFVGVLPFPGAKPLQYGGEGLSAGGFNGSKYGDDRHDEAVKYDGGYCMALQVNFAQQEDGQLGKIGIIPNIDAVETNPIAVPKGPDISPDDAEVEHTEAVAKKSPPIMVP